MTPLRRAVHAVFLILLIRLIGFAATEGAALAVAEREHRIRHRALYPPRGELLDAEGRPLATVGPGFEVWRRTPEGRAVRERRYISLGEALPIAWDLPFHPDLALLPRPIRRYPLGPVFAHLLGTVGEIDRATLRAWGPPYAAGDFVGKSGLERALEARLAGRRGFEEIEVDAFGRVRRTLGLVPARPGEDVPLTLLAPLGAAAREALAGRPGAVVALNPKTGALLAAVSSPDFDPNIFSDPARFTEQRAVFSDTRAPLSDRAFGGLYAPGSVFKVATLVGVLRSLRVDTTTRFLCRGSYAGKACWKAGGHGVLDAEEAFAQSCNVWFYQAAKVAGTKAIAEAARGLGVGLPPDPLLRATGTAASGVVPDEAWEKERFGEQAYWSEGDLLNTAIGQGYVLVTPFEVARMYGAALTGGGVMEVHVEAGVPPREIARLPIDEGTTRFLREASRATVVRGTGRRAAVPGLDVGAKTGTAENPHGDPHAWTVAAAPIDDPEIVVAALVENGGSGGFAAAPVARAVLTAWLNLRGDAE